MKSTTVLPPLFGCKTEMDVEKETLSRFFDPHGKVKFERPTQNVYIINTLFNS